MKSDKILILGASDLQLPLILKAKEMDLMTLVVDMNANAVGASYADKFAEISTIDIKKVVQFAVSEKVNGVLTAASDRPIRTVAAINAALGLSGIDEETAFCATDKAAMRRRLQRFEVPIPLFAVTTDVDHCIYHAFEINGSVILKPADNSGSRGVVSIDYKNKTAESIKDAYDYCRKYSSSGEVLIEELMRGPEFSVECLSNGSNVSTIQVTDKLTTGSPHFVEMGHTQPASQPGEVIASIKRIAAQAIEAIGIRNSPSHVEVMLTEQGPKIVELGARLGGDYITSHLVPLSTGVDMLAASIDLAMGKEVDFRQTKAVGSAVRYIQSLPGKVSAIRGIEQARMLRNVVEIKVNTKVGAVFTGVHNSSERVGHVIAQGDNAQHAASICQEAIDLISIETEQENS